MLETSCSLATADVGSSSPFFEDVAMGSPTLILLFADGFAVV
jgi:hypothetical protein